MGEGRIMATKPSAPKPAPKPAAPKAASVPAKTPAGKTVSTINAGIQEITGGYKPIATPKDATGMQGVGITGTDRNVAKEIEAFKLGYSQEYIASRGGLNSQGYWNDVPVSGQLTAEEQKSVLLPNGTVNTGAMAAILQKKAYDEAIANGGDPTDVLNKLKNQWGDLFDSSIGSNKGSKGGYDANGNPVTGGSYNSDGSLAASGASGAASNAIDNERRDAFAAIRKTLLTYGFTESEMAEIDKYISTTLTNPRIGAEQALIDMRSLNAYKARFAGNEARVKAGMNAFSEADYLRQEDSFLQYLKAGGVESLGNRALYSGLIGGAVAPDEVGKRINLAVNRVQNSDPEIKRQLQKFYPTITDKDMVAYFLNPTAALPELQKKTTAAEIGAAASNQGLNKSVAAEDIALYRKSAEDLAAYGIDRAAALEGYTNIATVLPTSQKLSSIYKESDINYTQQTAESEFLKSNVDAAEKRRQLKALETAAFSGTSGTSKVSFASQVRGMQ